MNSNQIADLKLELMEKDDELEDLQRKYQKLEKVYFITFFFFFFRTNKLINLI